MGLDTVPTRRKAMRFKPTNCQNVIVKKFQIIGGLFNKPTVGIVQCEDGYRSYMFLREEEQASIGTDTLEEAISKVQEIASKTGGELVEL